MAGWRNRVRETILRLRPAGATRFAQAALVLAVACSTVARGDSLGAERRAQLDHGTVEQKSEALAWLAAHGDQGATQAVARRLRDEDATIREQAEQTLWAIWTRSGDAEVDRLMEKGIGLMSQEDYGEALPVFEEIVRRMPEFAEGYNKRATVLYMLGDYLRAIEDVERTLRRNPEHFGALSGGGLCMLKLNRPDEALAYFERALAVNPNMDGIRFMAEQLRRARSKPLI